MNRATQKELMEDINEIKLLSKTLGLEIHETIIHNLRTIHPATLISKAKAEDTINKAKAMKCGNIIINQEISSSQMKNLQNIAGFDIKIMDRTGLIIDIFNIHAKSNESKKQVQLAFLEYMLPRLTRQWTHLERQMGGTGTRGGPGEKQIEIDRRLIRKDIDKLKRDLKVITRSRKTQRKNRQGEFSVSLVGYTNAGKSTIMNLLTDANLYAKNELFATLDSTTRSLYFDKKNKILLTDTVGFIQKLPHELVASFRSTLYDVSNSNLILKVIDSNYENISMHIDTIDKTLEEIDSSKIPFVLIFNKIDLIESKQIKALFKKYPNSLFLSAKDRIGKNDLVNFILSSLKKNHITKKIKVNYDKISILNLIYKHLDVRDADNKDKYIEITASGTAEQFNIIKSTSKKLT